MDDSLNVFISAICLSFIGCGMLSEGWSEAQGKANHRPNKTGFNLQHMWIVDSCNVKPRTNSRQSSTNSKGVTRLFLVNLLLYQGLLSQQPICQHPTCDSCCLDSDGQTPSRYQRLDLFIKVLTPLMPESWNRMRHDSDTAVWFNPTARRLFPLVV